LPYDEQADQQRMAAERQERLVAAWQEIADKEAELLDWQRAAEQEIEAVDLRAQEALREAEELLSEAEERYSRDSNSGVYYGYYPYWGHNKRWYRKNLSLYYRYPHGKHWKKYKCKPKPRPHPKPYHGYLKQRHIKGYGDTHQSRLSKVNYRSNIKHNRPRSHVHRH
jgi:hypothetical protein